VDPVSNTAVVIDDVGEDPYAIAAGEGGVWVADGTKGVRRIDPASNRVAATIGTGGLAFDVAVGDGAVWVGLAERLVRIDPQTDETEATALVCDPVSPRCFPGDFAAAGPGFAWLMSQMGSLFRYDEANGRFDEFLTHVSPRGLAVIGRDVWIATCGTPGTVVHVDASTGEVAATIPAGGAVCIALGGTPLAIAADEKAAWVADTLNGTISRIDETTNQTDVPIRVGDSPTAMAVGLDSVWVTVDGQSEEVSPSPSTS
jgi:DNA-binding beta-propeller fold protein YncE